MVLLRGSTGVVVACILLTHSQLAATIFSETLLRTNGDMPDYTRICQLAYLGIAAAVAGLVALSRTGKPRVKMPESSRTRKRLD
jgi:ABC-type Mn2+/Zn2+ transport system permease subunit